MKIDLTYDALDEIVRASLYESYEMHYSELLIERARLDNDKFNNKEFMQEEIERNLELLEALRTVLAYYDVTAYVQDRLAEIEKRVRDERDINRYENMLKNMGENSG